MKLDRLDKDLIKHLQKDAKLSLRELGKLLNVPHTTIFTRINKLVDNGVIQKFSAILHPHKLGFKINMFVIQSPSDPNDMIAAQLAEYEHVMKVFKSEDKIFVKAICHKEDTGCIDDIKQRLYGYDFTSHEINEVVKFEHNLQDGFIDKVE